MQDLYGGLAQRNDLFVAVLHDAEGAELRAKGLYYLQPADLQQINGFLNQAGPILDGDWSPLSLGSMAHWTGATMAGGSDPERRQILAAMQTELPRVMKGLQAALGQPGSYESPWPTIPLSSPLEADFASNRLDVRRWPHRSGGAEIHRKRQPELRPEQRTNRGPTAIDRRRAIPPLQTRSSA